MEIEVKKINKYSYENYYKDYYKKNKEHLNKKAVVWQRKEREELRRLRDIHKQLKVIVN